MALSRTGHLSDFRQQQAGPASRHPSGRNRANTQKRRGFAEPTWVRYGAARLLTMTTSRGLDRAMRSGGGERRESDECRTRDRPAGDGQAFRRRFARDRRGTLEEMVPGGILLSRFEVDALVALDLRLLVHCASAIDPATAQVRSPRFLRGRGMKMRTPRSGCRFRVLQAVIPTRWPRNRAAGSRGRSPPAPRPPTAPRAAREETVPSCSNVSRFSARRKRSSASDYSPLATSWLSGCRASIGKKSLGPIRAGSFPPRR
jgi:hypothetical protein